jgi:soluble lytic murein transglycosylase-like protein
MIRWGQSRRGVWIVTRILCGLAVGLLGPAMMRAQSPEPRIAALEAWRSSLTQRLDEDIVRLVADGRNEPAAAPLTASVPANQGTTTESPRPSLPFTRSPQRRFPMIEGILAAQGLPAGLRGIVAVESNFNPAALSPKGARGLWQLMPATARRYGMVVDDRQDERLDPRKSTLVAARYLHDLYAQFQDWLLVLAAYNAGEGRVQNAVERIGAHDFWTLSQQRALSDETRRYVPAVLDKSSARPEALTDMYPAAGGAPFRLGLVRSIGSAPESIQTIYAMPSSITFAVPPPRLEQADSGNLHLLLGQSPSSAERPRTMDQSEAGTR